MLQDESQYEPSLNSSVIQDSVRDSDQIYESVNESMTSTFSEVQVSASKVAKNSFRNYENEQIISPFKEFRDEQMTPEESRLVD